MTQRPASPEPDEGYAPAEHTPECRKWYLAFRAAKTYLEQAQRGCPCCQLKRKERGRVLRPEENRS